MKPATLDVLRRALRLFLGALLLWAAITKLSNPTEFLGTIYGYQLPLPHGFLKVVAVFLPWMELLCGLLLLGNVWPETTLICTSALFLIFLLITGQAWLRGLQISCGCFNLTIFGLNRNHPELIKFLESVGFAFARSLVLSAMALFLLRRKLAESKTALTDRGLASGVPQKPATKQQKRTASAR